MSKAKVLRTQANWLRTQARDSEQAQIRERTSTTKTQNFFRRLFGEQEKASEEEQATTTNPFQSPIKYKLYKEATTNPFQSPIKYKFYKEARKLESEASRLEDEAIWKQTGNVLLNKPPNEPTEPTELERQVNRQMYAVKKYPPSC